MKKQFSPKIEFVNEMLFFVESHCKKMGFDSKALNKVRLAVEEAIVNIIKHGFKDKREGCIELICEECSHKPGIKITIKDQGSSFNLKDKIQKVQDTNFHNQPARGISESNGYGIFLYVTIMDSVDYKIENGWNNLYLIKYLDSE